MSANHRSKYVSILGDAPPGEVGAITFWNHANACDRPTLAAAWANAGLDVALLPADKSPEVALREAVDTVCAARRFRRKAPGGGWVIVNEQADGKDLRWEAGARVGLDKVGRMSVVFPPQADPSTPDNVALAAELTSAYERHLWTLDGATVTGWLVALARKLGAVGLKDTGGVYFVPSGGLAAWRTMVGVVRDAARTEVHEIATVLVEAQAERIISAIVSAVEREAGEEAEAMLNELADPNLELGKRALATRMERVNALRAKVSSYGELLGASMGQLSARLEQLSASVATAALVAGSK